MSVAELKALSEPAYSQQHQDALLDTIFANIKPNASPYCVEFGFNAPSLDCEQSGANCAKLIAKHGWDYLLLDGRYENESINLHKHFLTSSNICSIFRSYNVPVDCDYISIDVDSTDLWLFKSLLSEYNAKVYSVEFNPSFPHDRAITFIEISHRYFGGDRAYGASLKALNDVAKEFNYSLL